MELTTARRLADLNRRFYEEHAAAFANARSTPQPGVKRILTLISPGASVLEVGCGDGKVARALAAGSNVSAYLGLDLSPAMLDRARAGLPSPSGRRGGGEGEPRIEFSTANLTSPDWSQVLASRAFDWILAFAVFHHVPGFDARARALQALADHLASGGALVMSNWQFTRSERLRRRILPWSTLNLAQSDVERGDYLLPWERSRRRGLRYVHVLDEAEARRLAEGAGLQVVEVFTSDGVTGDLADYVRMRKSE